MLSVIILANLLNVNAFVNVFNKIVNFNFFVNFLLNHFVHYVTLVWRNHY